MILINNYKFLPLFCLTLCLMTQLSSGVEIPLSTTFVPYAHGLSSGSVTLKDTKTIQINNFKYDGEGPDAWFQIGMRNDLLSPYTNPKERADLSKNRRIPDENGSCDIVKGYKGKDITLTLPENVTFTNVEYVALYCYKFTHNFGYINIPQSLANLNRFPSNKTPPSYCSGSTVSIKNMIQSGSAIVLASSLIMVSFAMNCIR